ncbi:extracellular solute-binding protein [Fischerella sp. NIES-4106]|nr:extracellular solute-binding protein [Fischerella sp. NIES-4106]
MGNPKQVMMGGWENRAVGRKTLHPKPTTRNYFLRSIGKKIILLLLLFALVIADTQSSASAAELPEIRRRGYLNIAVKDNLRPLGFTDTKGNLQGFEIDLAQKLAADLLGKTNAVKLKPVANRDRLSQVIDHKVDLTIARVTATESRARLVSLSIPYYFDGTRLITKNTSIQKLGDIDKQKIAVLKNSSTIADIKYYLPQVDLVGVNSYAEGRSLLENNTVVAFAADTSVLSGWVQQYPQYRLVPVKLSTEPLSVVMPKGLQYDDLRRQVNGAIARYLEKGWLQQRAQHWGLP